MARPVPTPYVEDTEALHLKSILMASPLELVLAISAGAVTAFGREARLEADKLPRALLPLGIRPRGRSNTSRRLRDEL